MPTRNRRRFVAQSVRYFLRQDYARRELVIVDDGEDPVDDLVPPDTPIRYIRIDRRTSLARKRDLGCEAARGELIANWDDDDWVAPNRLSVQVAALDGADLCGLTGVVTYDLHGAAAWRERQDNASIEPDPATLLYRRSLWEGSPKPDESWRRRAAAWRRDGARLRAVEDAALYVKVWHGDNTHPVNFADPRWQRQRAALATQLLDANRAFYVMLRSGERVSTRATPAIGTLTLAAPFAVAGGYSSMAEYLALGLARTGVQLDLLPLGLNPEGLTEAFHTLLRRSTRTGGDVVLLFSPLNIPMATFAGARHLIINTMWEGSRLPPGWAETLNKAGAVIVPSAFVARVCRESGVTRPVTVVPEGVDPEIYPWIERPVRETVTTLVVAPVSERKNTDIAIAAWGAAFAGDPDARLVIKTHYNYGNYWPDDPRITVMEQPENTRGLRRYYEAADVLLALGNEGFGLPLVEAMATGLPAIALDAEGQADVCAAATDYLLPVPAARTVTYPTMLGPGGQRSVPAVEDVTDRLRWVADHRQAAQAMGRAASAWVHAHRNVWDKAPAVLDVIEAVTYPTHALREAPTFWVPSWQTGDSAGSLPDAAGSTPCGVAAYAAHLRRAIPGARVAAQPPDPRTSSVIHIQYEPSLMDDASVARAVTAAQRGGAAVAVTEHRIDDYEHPWEAMADALVAPTAAGADQLWARRPNTRVVHIPLGCPTPLPELPTRLREPAPARPRVIGAFGILGRHKRFWELLDVLRALPGTELLLFSYAKSSALAEAWRAASTGLPVRWIERNLPEEQVMQRLAAEADVLVYWYQAMPWRSASAAVRLGLATGVPVLASPTGWFEDLAEVTYQPQGLVEGVQRLLDDTALRLELAAAAKAYCHAHRWSRIAEMHLALWQALRSASR